MSKIAMVPCWSSRPSTSCFPGCAISSPTVSTTAPTCPKLSPNSASGPSRSSNAPLTLSAFNCCCGAGSSNGPWLGSIATAAWRRISRRRLRAPRRGFTSPLYSSSSGDWLDPYAMYLRYNTTIPIQIQTLRKSVGSFDRVEFAVDVDLFELVDQDDRRISENSNVSLRHLDLKPLVGPVAKLFHDRAGFDTAL